jgi:hypothetical protein
MIRDDMLKNRINKLLMKSLTPILVQNGFNKRGSVYTRASRSLLHMVDVQHSRWNDTIEVSFTLNCGVYMPGVTSTFRNISEPKQPKPTDCCIAVRVGMLTESRLDRWWRISKTDGSDCDRKIGEEIVSVVERFVLPFLQRFQQEKSVPEFLSQPRHGADEYVEPRADGLRLSYAAIAWSILGARSDCQTCLERAISLSKKTPMESIISSFASRFTC